MTKVDDIMCKIISDEKEGFEAFDEAADHMLQTDEWDKNLFPKFNTDTIIGEMATRIIFNMYKECVDDVEDVLFWMEIWDIYFQTIYDNPNMCQCTDKYCWIKILDELEIDNYHFADIIVTLIKDMVTQQPIKEYKMSMYSKTQKFNKITKPIGNYKAFKYNDTNSETSDIIDNANISNTKSQQSQATSNKKSVTLKINGVEYEIKLSNPINDKPVDITINDGNSTVTITI